MQIRPLTRDFITGILDDLIGISADTSPWDAAAFMLDLPGKWDLSFALFDGESPVGYCILSRKFGPPHIHQFMVRKSIRGTGAGRVMLNHVKTLGYFTLKVHKENTGAVRFYQREGLCLMDQDGGEYLWMAFGESNADTR